MICSKLGDEYIEARKELDRSLDYRCPECDGQVILKAGDIMTHHFAHRVDCSCNYGVGETEWHRFAKTWTAKFMRMKGWDAHIEHKLGNRRTDLFIVNPYNEKCCFEFQRKDEGNEIYKRTADLAAFCDSVVWVLPFDAVRIKKKWRINHRHAIQVLYSDMKPDKSEVLFFKHIPRCANLYKCDIEPWMLDKKFEGRYGRVNVPSSKWYEIKITSLQGGRFSREYK